MALTFDTAAFDAADLLLSPHGTVLSAVDARDGSLVFYLEEEEAAWSEPKPYELKNFNKSWAGVAVAQINFASRELGLLGAVVIIPQRAAKG